MKTLCISLTSVVLLAGRSATAADNRPAPPESTPYVAVEKGPHHQILESTSYEVTSSGGVVPHVHRYEELATGLNFWDSTAGEWKESKEYIESYPEGAIARQGQHRVIFEKDLATAGAIDLEMPDGRRLRSHILGLAYLDQASGRSVLIAEITNCVGQILPPNQVLYENAFTDFKADVRYTYTKAGFEQDIILRERPPAPEEYGLNSATTLLQVLTEFISPPQPDKKQHTFQSPSGILSDEELNFGVMRIRHGKAFLIEGDPAQIPVVKQWLKLSSGRDFLIESVPVAKIAAKLDQLPAPGHAMIQPDKGSVRHVVSTERLLPKPKIAKAGKGEMKVAKLKAPAQGLVLDYQILSSNTNDFTFLQNETFYITGPVNISGTTMIRSNAVIKFASGAGAKISVDVLTCDNTPEKPTIFTAKDDDRFGEQIVGSSGAPSGYYPSIALEINHNGDTELKNVRIAYAQTAVQYGTVSQESTNTVQNIEIARCYTAFYVDGQSSLQWLKVKNGLVTKVDTAFELNYAGARIEYLTADQCFILANDPGYGGYSCLLTNSILANVTNHSGYGGINVGGSYNGFYNTPTNTICYTDPCDDGFSSSYTNTFSPFQTGPLGFHYLATNSAFVDAGNMSAADAGLSSYTTRTNQVTDSGTVDLGYHYPVVTPKDTDQDGIADYLEDVNQNGIYDAGDTSDWNNPDTDYDGRSDGQEVTDGTDRLNPNSVISVMLGFWKFDNTNTWAGEQGQLPLQVTNVNGIVSWSSNAVMISSASPAILRYRDVETNTSANINCRRGTVRFWIRPVWASQTNGAGPESEGRLIELGTKGSSDGWWGLVLNSAGTNLNFCTQTNSASTLKTNLSAPVSWSYDWHQIVLTYSSSNSSLYLDGQPVVTNGLGVTNWPGLTVRANGFRIGSDAGGTNQARGHFENLQTFNYVLTATEVAAGYSPALPNVINFTNFCDTSRIKTNGHARATNTADGCVLELTPATNNKAGSFFFTNGISFSPGSSFSTFFSFRLSQGGGGGASDPDGFAGADGIAFIVCTGPTNLGGDGGGGLGYANISNSVEVEFDTWDNTLDLDGNHVAVMYDGDHYNHIVQTNLAGHLNDGNKWYVWIDYQGASSNLEVRVSQSTNRPAIPTLKNTVNIASHLGTTNGYLGFSGATGGQYNQQDILSWRIDAGGPELSVAITSPADNQVYVSSPTNLTITAVASTASGTISWVEFFAGANSLGVVADGGASSNQYQVYWDPAWGSTNVLKAVARNSSGIVATSDPVTIKIKNAPMVSITNPVTGSYFGPEPTNITINATASGDGGAAITNVSLYQGTNILKSFSSAPYNFVWSNVTAGIYTLKATATDSNGASATSKSVKITVDLTNQPPVVNAGSNQTIRLPAGADLTGIVSDDGLPRSNSLSIAWAKVSGPGTVTFANSNSPGTTASFSTSGSYVLQLSANDSQYTVSSNVTITVLPANVAPTVKAGTNQTITLAARYSPGIEASYSALSASIRSSRGKEFWFGFPTNGSGLPEEPMLFISSETNTLVSIIVPGLGFFTNCVVSTGKVSWVTLPIQAEAGSPDGVENKGVHVVARDEVTVYGFCEKLNWSEAYLGLPVNTLGTNYIVLGWKTTSFIGATLHSELLIVGAAKSTTVTITPSVTVGSRTAHTNYTVNLDAGQTYELIADDVGEDLSGTIITADKPIAVFGGNRASVIPDGIGDGEMLVEQIPPINCWGREFYTVPFASRTNGDVFQVIAAFDGTAVSNELFSITLTNKGDRYVFTNASASRLLANKPVLLAQYSTGRYYDPIDIGGDYYGDPLMMLVPPSEQFLTHYTISSARHTNAYSPDRFPYNHLNLVARGGTNASSISIRMDGVIINPANYVHITNGYYRAQLVLSNGSHDLRSDMPFGVFVYGWDVAESYGYPGGMGLGSIVDVGGISVSPKAATNGVNSTYCLTATVTNLSGQPLSGLRVDFEVTGSNSLVGVAFTDESGQARFCYTGTNVGTDMIRAYVGTNSDWSTNTWEQPWFVLRGSVTDDGLPDGKTNVLWIQETGPSTANFSSDSVTNPIVKVSEEGFYVFRLRGDDTEFTNYSKATVTLRRNQAPGISAGPNQITKLLTIPLNGSATDDGLPVATLTTTWKQVSGPGTVTFGNSNQPATTATLTVPGTYVLRLTASDSQATVSADVTITLAVDPVAVDCGQTNAGALATTDLRSVNRTNCYADYYRFSGKSNHVVVMTMTSTNVDAYLFLRDSQMRLLAEDDDYTNGTHARLVYTFPADGDFIIEASSFGSGQTGSYQLTFECPPPTEWSATVTFEEPDILAPYCCAAVFETGPTNIPVEVTVTASGPVRQVDFYTNNILLTTLSNAPYQLTWSNVAVGFYKLSAVASGYDIYGTLRFATSAPRAVVVGTNQSFVRILAPASGSVYPVVPADITIEILSFCTNSSEGRFDSLTLYTNGVEFPAAYPPSTGNFSTYAWTNVALGTYSLTYVGTWVSTSVTSAPVVVHVGQDRITLSPVSDCARLTDTLKTITVALTNRSGSAVAGSNVTVTVTGANPIILTTVTDSNGFATVTYQGREPGRDQIVASAVVDGRPAASNSAEQNWARALSCGTLISGTLTTNSGTSSRSGYADYFSFTGTSNQTVAITLSSAAFDAYLILRTTNCTALATNDDFSGTDSRIIYTIPSNGTYIVEAATLLPKQTGAYSLQFDCNTNSSAEIAVLKNGQSLPNYALVDFGPTTTNVPVSITLTITNQGNSGLRLDSLGITGDFTNVSQPSALIPVGGSSSFVVRYNATSNCVATGTLSFVSNDGNGSDGIESPWVLNLTGIGNPAGPLPVVNLTTPTNNVSFAAGIAVPVSATASPGTNDVTISKVELFAATVFGKTLIARVTSSPYSNNWINPDPGTYSVIAAATDSAGRTSYSTRTNIQILPVNTNVAPVAVKDSVAVLLGSSNNVIDVLANDTDANGDPLTVTGVSNLHLGSASVINNGRAVSYTPTNTIGGDWFSYTISDDKGGTATANVLINVFNPGALPTITLDTPTNTQSFGWSSNVTITATASNSVGTIKEVTFFLDYKPYQTFTSGPYTTNWTAFSGTHRIYARVIDSFGRTVFSATNTITVSTNANDQWPIAAISNLTNRVEVLEGNWITNLPIVRDGLFVLNGTARDPDGADPVSYQINLYRPDGTLAANLLPFRSASVTNGALATNDFTGLENGVYDLELIVRGGYRQVSTNITFMLESNLKIGQFGFSQQDLAIPVAGIPLTVVRTYNSLNLSRGDFGYGWTYALNELATDLNEFRENTEDLTDPDGAIFSKRAGGSRDVTLTLPDGQRTTFSFYFKKGPDDCFCYYARWKAAPGVTATLEAQGNTTLQVIPFSGLRYWQASGPLVPMDAYDFPGYVLTMLDGTKYTISRADLGEHDVYNPSGLPYSVQARGTPRLARIEQRTLDTITINSDSIVHTNAAGVETRRITFERNAKGLITAVRDPNAGSNGLPAMKYEYDSNDNLLNVLRLMDRAGGIYETTTFQYTNSRYPHYITGIIDPRGVAVARNEYDDNGKLKAVVDANGKRTELYHDVNGRKEVVVDRLGQTNTFVYDARGNVTAQTNALGEWSLKSYDDTGHVTAIVDSLGNTDRFAYDANGNQTQAINALNRTNFFVYDANGGLLSQKDPLGNVSSNRYDSFGNVTNTIQLDPSGNVVEQSFSKYENTLLVEGRNANNQVTASFGYDSVGNLTNTTDARGFGRRVSYNANGSQTNTSYTWTPPGGLPVTVTTSTTYDSAGRIIQSIDALGNTNRTVYGLVGKVDYTIDKFGNTNSFVYDTRGNLIQTIYPEGLYTRTVYNDEGKPVLTLDRNGITGTRTEYDAVGRVIRAVRLTNVTINITSSSGVMQSSIGSLGVPISTNSIEYFANGWVKTLTSSDGQKTSYGYWPDGQTKYVTNALNQVTYYEYDQAGRRKLVRDALNRENQFQYDAVGRMIKTIFADGTFTTNIFNHLGQRTGVKDQANQLTQFAYDISGTLTNVTKPQVPDPENGNNLASPVWSYVYDQYGQQTAMIDPKGRATTNLFDALGRQVGARLPMGEVSSNVFNAKGQLWKQYDFKGQWTTLVYDNFGRLKAKFLFNAGAAYPSNSVCYSYNTLGQLARITERYGADASTNSCDSYFALVGKPIGESRYAVALALCAKASPALLAVAVFCCVMTLVPSGRKLRAALAAYYLRGGWQFGFPALASSGRRLRMPSYWLRGVAIFAAICLIGSDPHLNHLWTVHAQCTIPFNGSNDTMRITDFTYDLDGRLTQMNAPEGVINYGYDITTGQHTRTCTANSETQYGYDELGRLKTVTQLKRNGVAISPETTTYTYTAVGSRQTMTLPNGIIATYTYDNLNRLTNMTHQAGTTNLATFSYKVDSTGRRTNAVDILRQEDGGCQTNTFTWQFDAMYRLTNETCVSSVAGGTYTNAFQYDKAGNRLKKTRTGSGAETITCSYSANDQLTGETNGAVITAYLYDPNGSLTNRTAGGTVTSYTYNLANKLSAVAVGGVVQASYQYNDQGIRVRANTGSTKYYLIDANNHTGYQQVLEELNTVGGTPTTSYVFGDDVLGQCGTTTSDPRWLLYDGHGSTRQLARPNTTVSSRYNFDANGVTLSTSSAPETSLLYCGEQFDTTLGMYNLRARYYDPNNGRFNTRDSFSGNNADPQSLHKYLYANCDPVNAIDPSGNFSTLELLVVASIIIILLVVLIPKFVHVKKASAWASMIPLIGSIWDAAYEFQEGNYGWAAFYTVLAISDVFLIKSLATSGFKLLTKLGATGSGEMAHLLGSASGQWVSRPGGIRMLQQTGYWIKEVDPAATGFAKWFAETLLEAQAHALQKLGDMAPKFFYANGKLVIQDAGKFSGNIVDFLKLRIKGSWRMGEIFNDIKPSNIGSAGLIFDPALHPIHLMFLAIGAYLIGRESAMHGTAAYGD